jgi:tetratricopeptide (TPR) repeat protein
MSSDLLEQAHRHRLSGEYAEADALYRRILAEDQDGCAEACWGLGHTLMNMGDFDACPVFFQRAIDAEPDNSLFLLDLGKFLAMLGEDDQAKTLFERVVELGGNERYVSEAKKQLAYY